MTRFLIVLASVFFITTTANAHSPLKSTAPQKDAILEAAPKEIVLNFAKMVRITKVTLAKDDTEAKLELPFKKFTNDISIPNPTTGVGSYTVNWRALGKDGHALKGSFSFTVSGE
ncbi:MAG: copper resistance CopC family protein [Rhizobiaceae bacterium]